MVPEGFKAVIRLRVDTITKNRLEDCSHRKGFSEAELIRMSWRYWIRVRNCDSMPSLTYGSGTKHFVVEASGLFVPEDCKDCHCAVIHHFLDVKDDGKCNGPGQRGRVSDEGIEETQVATLGQTLTHDAFGGELCTCAVYEFMGTRPYTLCSPGEPIEAKVCDLTETTVTCVTCCTMLAAARRFPIMQYHTISKDEF